MYYELSAVTVCIRKFWESVLVLAPHGFIRLRVRERVIQNSEMSGLFKETLLSNCFFSLPKLSAMSEGNQNEQDQRQQRTDQSQDFNISIHDILENGNPLESSDPTFANLNHGNAVEDNSQVFARLPAELQHIFSTSDTDDLFGTSGPNEGSMTQLNQALWARSQDQGQGGASAQGPWMIPNSGSISLAQQPSLMATMPSVSAAMSQPQNMTNTPTQPTPAPTAPASTSAPATPSSAPPTSAPTSASSGGTSTHLPVKYVLDICIDSRSLCN